MTILLAFYLGGAVGILATIVPGYRVIVRWLRQADAQARAWELDARYWFNRYEDLRRAQETPDGR